LVHIFPLVPILGNRKTPPVRQFSFFILFAVFEFFLLFALDNACA